MAVLSDLVVTISHVYCIVRRDPLILSLIISHEYCIILCKYLMMSFNNPSIMHYLAELFVFVFLQAMRIVFSGTAMPISRNITITNCRQTHGTVRKSHITITRHQEDKQSKATSSLFPIKMIAKLEWTQSNAIKNIELLQNPTMGATINNESTTTEPSP